MVRPTHLAAALGVLLVVTLAVKHLAGFLGGEVLLTLHSLRLHSLKELLSSSANYTLDFPSSSTSSGLHTTHCLGHLVYKLSRLFVTYDIGAFTYIGNA